MVAPLLIAALTPFVKDLFANGLSLLGNAILAKGKEKVEETLGVKLPPEGQPLSPEKLAEMRQLEFTHEEKLLELGIKKQELELEAEKSATEAVTKRWEADMLSDSWLSKNVRPLVLVTLLCAYLLFAIGSACGVDINQAYVELLGQWGMMVMSAYFVGRTVEKGIDVYQGWKQTKGE
jgi:hypothetical protein